MRFEARLILAVAIFASALTHALGIFFSHTGKAKQEAVSLELFVPVEVETEPEGGGGGGEGEGEGEPSVTPLTSTSWRGRWRAKEARYREDARVQDRNIALLGPGVGQARGDDEGSATLFYCDPEGLQPIEVVDERDVSHWGGLVPTGIFRAAYMEGMALVSRSSSSKLGALEFALPARQATVPLDEPANAVVEVGRLDARCLVGISYGEGVFPISLRGLPVRVAHEGVIKQAVIDLKLFADGRFTLVHRKGDLGFTEGALYNHESVSRSLRTFYAGAALLKR